MAGKVWARSAQQVSALVHVFCYASRRIDRNKPPGGNKSCTRAGTSNVECGLGVFPPHALRRKHHRVT
eukprot:13205894-Alexandrium_andersonii.AAC.1